MKDKLYVRGCCYCIPFKEWDGGSLKEGKSDVRKKNKTKQPKIKARGSLRENTSNKDTFITHDTSTVCHLCVPQGQAAFISASYSSSLKTSRKQHFLIM